MSRKRRHDSHTSVGMAEAHADARRTVEPPEGVELPSDAHRAAWGRLTALRAPRDWREADLDMLVRITDLTVQINSRQGDQSELERASREKLAYMRAMGIVAPAGDTRTLHRRLQAVEESKEAQGHGKTDTAGRAVSLFAQRPATRR